MRQTRSNGRPSQHKPHNKGESMSTIRNNRQRKKTAQADLRKRVLQHFKEFQFREAALAAFRQASPELCAKAA